MSSPIQAAAITSGASSSSKSTPSVSREPQHFKPFDTLPCSDPSPYRPPIIFEEHVYTSETSAGVMSVYVSQKESSYSDAKQSFSRNESFTFYENRIQDCAFRPFQFPCVMPSPESPLKKASIRAGQEQDQGSLPSSPETLPEEVSINNDPSCSTENPVLAKQNVIPFSANFNSTVGDSCSNLVDYLLMQNQCYSPAIGIPPPPPPPQSPSATTPQKGTKASKSRNAIQQIHFPIHRVYHGSPMISNRSLLHAPPSMLAYERILRKWLYRYLNKPASWIDLEERDELGVGRFMFLDRLDKGEILCECIEESFEKIDYRPFYRSYQQDFSSSASQDDTQLLDGNQLFTLKEEKLASLYDLCRTQLMARHNLMRFLSKLRKLMLNRIPEDAIFEVKDLIFRRNLPKVYRTLFYMANLKKPTLLESCVRNVLGDSALRVQPIERLCDPQVQPGEEWEGSFRSSRLANTLLADIPSTQSSAPPSVVGGTTSLPYSMSNVVERRQPSNAKRPMTTSANTRFVFSDFATQRPMKRLSILVMGLMGSGKSATINRFFDLNLMKESPNMNWVPTNVLRDIDESIHPGIQRAYNESGRLWPTGPFDPRQTSSSDVHKAEIKVDDVLFRIVEIPSTESYVSATGVGVRSFEHLGDFQRLKRDITKERFDVVIITESLDHYDKKQARLIYRQLLSIFGHRVWERLLVVLTHGYSLPPDIISYNEYIARRIQMIHENVHRVSGNLDIFVDIIVVENSQSCPTDPETDEPILPNGETFLPEFGSIIAKIALTKNPNRLLAPSKPKGWWIDYALGLAGIVLFAKLGPLLL